MTLFVYWKSNETHLKIVKKTFNYNGKLNISKDKQIRMDYTFISWNWSIFDVSLKLWHVKQDIENWGANKMNHNFKKKNAKNSNLPLSFGLDSVKSVIGIKSTVHRTEQRIAIAIFADDYSFWLARKIFKIETQRWLPNKWTRHNMGSFAICIVHTLLRFRLNWLTENVLFVKSLHLDFKYDV